MTWMELSDQYVKSWQDAASRYLSLFQDQPYFLESWGQLLDQSLQFKKMADQMPTPLYQRGERFGAKTQSFPFAMEDKGGIFFLG